MAVAPSSPPPRPPSIHHRYYTTNLITIRGEHRIFDSSFDYRGDESLAALSLFFFFQFSHGRAMSGLIQLLIKTFQSRMDRYK